jgi:hypothetical protein
MNKYPNPKAISDKSADRLNFNNTVPKIIHFIEEMDTPAIFGIYGCWGSGKTTLMQLTQQELQTNYHDSVNTLWFDAWQYELLSEGSMIFALLKKITDSFASNTSRLQKIIKNGLPVIIEMASTYTNIAGSTGNSNPLSTNSLTNFLKSPFVDPILSKYNKELSAMEEFKRLFSKEIEDILIREHKDKLVIFIDDMDRCLPNSAVRFLEILKHFINSKRCIFILAIDNKIIARHINNVLWHPAIGDEYLQKLIPYSFYIPNKSINKLAVETLIDSDLTTEQQEIIAKTISINAKNNIRQAQIVLHKFIFYARLIDLKTVSQELHGQNTSYALLIKWLLIKEILPTLVQEYGWEKILKDIISDHNDNSYTEHGMEIHNIMQGKMVDDPELTIESAIIIEEAIQNALYS